MTKTDNVKPFGMKDKLGYMFGDFGNDFTFILSSMLLMKFYSDVMGVEPALVGFMMAAARLVDAVTDVTMGQLVDRSKSTKAGKFKPWLLRMSGFVAISSFLMYASWFADRGMTFKIVWMFGTYFLWGSVFYTSANIPYGSMASAISADPKDRAQLSNFRTIGASLAGTVIGVILPLVVYEKDAAGNDILIGSRVSVAALLCSVGAVICYILCYYMCTERVKVEQKTEKFELGKLVKGLIANKALIGIVLASVFQLLVQLTQQTMTTYVFPNYFRNTTAQSASGLVGVVVTIVLALFTVRLSMRFGRKELAIAAAVFGSIVNFVLFFLQTTNAWVFIGGYAISYIGLGIFSLICWAMITDVIDDTEVRTGARSDGEIYSIYSFARKLGQSASALIGGALLSFIGYSAETQFDPDVTQGIYNMTCLVPAIGFVLLAIVLYFAYPLSRKRVEENAKILAGKAAKEL